MRWLPHFEERSRYRIRSTFCMGRPIECATSRLSDSSVLKTRRHFVVVHHNDVGGLASSDLQLSLAAFTLPASQRARFDRPRAEKQAPSARRDPARPRRGESRLPGWWRAVNSESGFATE